MKHLLVTLVSIIIFSSCKNEKITIVDKTFVNSLISHYTVPQAVTINQKEIEFWKNRITTNTPDYSNTTKYAAALVARFHLTGNIADVKKSDSLLIKLAGDYRSKEVGPIFSMISHSILQHRFKEADSLLNIAKTMGIKKYESAATSFDVDFELGRILEANLQLKSIKVENDFGYQFRKSKMMHYQGELDSSIVAMKKAAENAGGNQSLQLSALSNLGDLYIHAGKLNEAYSCFVDCIRANSSDLHSIMGIGWVALVKDKNDSLAEKIFQFVATKTASPDPLFKLIAVAEHRSDSTLEWKLAKTFEEKVTNPLYGNMYHKYLIQLYTGILHDPAKAVVIAKKELDNRNTPQTNAWYVWSLLCNQQQEQAYQIYQKEVAGKPLEGLELYWMGKLMKSMNKGYNAKQYFEEANKNSFDLSPSVVKDLAILLKE